MYDNSPFFVEEMVFHSLLLTASFLVVIVFLFWRAYAAKKRSNIRLRVINKEIEAQNKQIMIVQEEILLKNRELTEAKEKAESATTAKQNFLSNMSHEIRTPLNAILGFSDILLIEQPMDRQLEYLKAIKFSGENLLVLVNDILDLTKIEEGKITIESVDYNLIGLLHQIQQLHLGYAREKGIQLSFEIDKNISPIVNGDPIRLTQIINNLLSNAIKFTSKGSVLLLVSRVSGSSHIQKVSFHIKDTGIGISHEESKRIFERFEQGNSDTTRKFGGSGLGLTITRHLLQLHGSDIHLDSSPGKGSDFYFDLEFKTGNTEEVFNMTFTDKLNSELTLKNREILVVEDNELNLKVTTRFLLKWEANVESARNGQEAVRIARNKKFDLILMDLQMPVMDGYEAVKLIRSDIEGLSRQAPVIALTADVMINNIDTLKSLGFYDYLTKPFQPNDLKIKINKSLDARKM